MSDTIDPKGTSPRRHGALLLALALLVGVGLGGGAVLLAGRLHAEAEVGGGAGAGPAAGATAAAAPARARYQCPMHPDVVSEDPAFRCPICGMKLVKIAAAGTPAPTAATAAPAPPPGHVHAAADPDAKPQWQCPMHPSIVQDRPGDCPICGMKLVKLEPGAAAEGDTGPLPEGLATVTIEPARQQLIGLKTVKVMRGQVGGAWRTNGRVSIDETRVHHVNVKVGGFVEHDHATFVGKTVRKGEPLFALYSPDLLAAQEELLLALRTRDTLAGGASGAAADGDALVSAARRKLELWDVSPAEVARVEKTGTAVKNVMFYAPASGVVTKRDVVPGMRIEAGAMPYEIVDLSRVWVLADVYESELRHVKVGQGATLTLKAYPNRKFQGRVAFVDPILDPKSRTLKVRLDFPNPDGALKPEMFGEVLLAGNSREGLVVPADAVIDSGTMRVVFVSAGEGRFQPREVRLGDGDGRHVEVLDGLHEGEGVVTGANFLVDSESRLRASLAAMASGAVKKDGKAPDPGAAPTDPHAGHGSR